MNEGKELLFKILNNKIQELSNINLVSYIYDDINLVELSSSLKKDYSNISIATNNLIKNILENTENVDLIPSVIRVKDLFVGKRDYSINLSLTNEFKMILDAFICELDERLESYQKDITRKDEIIGKCNNVIYKINNKEIIEDIPFVKEIVSEYDVINKSHNLVAILIFITRHNLELLNSVTLIPKGTIDNITLVSPNIDDRIIEILDNLNIKIETLPNYFISELKKCDVENALDVYNLIKKNKIEKYGILHLISKDNYIAKLILILYSDVKTIKCVVDEIVDTPNRESITALRNIVNLVTSVFISHPNDYFKSKLQNFKIIMGILKELDVNYKELITKCPLFLLNDPKLLSDILYEFEINGFNKKLVINRCYKTLSINPGLLTINLNILLKQGVNLEEYAKNDEYKYSLLKCKDLQRKLDYLTSKGNVSINPLDYNKAYKILNNEIMSSDDNL